MTSKTGRGGRRTAPYAFTELGVAMLSSPLRSEQAIRMNIQIMRTFVVLRRVLESHGSLADKIDELEDKYDRKFTIVFDAIHKITASPPSTRRRIGFKAEPRTGAR